MMPILSISGLSGNLEAAKKDATFLRILISSELGVEEWPIDATHISLRFQEIEGEFIGDVELLIFAHFFPERVVKKDKICFRIRQELEERWNQRVRVWLLLSDMGYGTQSHRE